MADEHIQIGNGEKRVIVNDDPARVIVFNPQDVIFVERFYRLCNEAEEKQAEFNRQIVALKAKGVDDKGYPTDVEGMFALARETCESIRAEIDRVFGEGTSAAAFGEALNPYMFADFFDGVMPFIQGPRTEKMQKYINTATKPKRPRHTKKS